MFQRTSTLATVWRVVFRLMTLYGLDEKELMADLGVDPEELRDVGARIPTSLADRAFKEAMRRIPDPAFALRAAECWHPSNLGTLGYAWLSSRTLHSGLKRMQRFSRIIGDDFHYGVREVDGALEFTHHHGRGEQVMGHYMTDFTLSVILDMCRRNAGERLCPRLVTLRRPLPDDPGPWRAFYGCEVSFGAERDAFYLDLAIADAPLPTANVPMANTFDEILVRQMERLLLDDVVSRCKALVLRELTSGPPSAAWVASELGMSRRSLQRKLNELGVSYKDLVDEVRHDLAQRYLGDATQSLGEITFRLGFSEQSAFARAFRRWSGMSPSRYRASLDSVKAQ